MNANVKVRLLSQFPAQVDGSGPITVDKTGGAFTIGYDQRQLALPQSIDRDTTIAVQKGNTVYRYPVLSIAAADNYQGTWNASTNFPTIASGIGSNGDYYTVATAGATMVDGNNVWNTGDIIRYSADANAWQRVPNGYSLLPAPAFTLTGNATNVTTAPQNLTPAQTVELLRATQAQAETGVDNATAMTPLRVRQADQRRVIMLSDFAVGDGVADDAAAINAALLFASTTGLRRVVGTMGRTYRIGSTINMRPGVVLDGNGATITQASGANLLELIEFTSKSASGAVLKNFVVDGNRAVNTDNNNVVLVRVGTASDVTLRNNTIRNSCGYAIVVNYSFRNQIIGNKISNTFLNALAIFNSAPATLQSVDAYHVIRDNEVMGATRGAFLIGYANHCEITSNKISGLPWGLPGNRTRVNTSGTTITWVSGQNFASVKTGMWAVLNNGAEYVITAVNSATSLTVSTAMPTLTNTPADVGCGDGIGIVASAYCRIQSNDVSYCVSFGMGLSTGNGENGCSYNIMSGNVILATGKSGINVAYDGGASIVLGNTISNNVLVACASGSGGSALLDKMAITITGQTVGKIEQTSIIGNTVSGFPSDGRTTYWLGTDGQCSDGSIIVRANTGIDCVNGDKIYNDIRQIVIDPGWGSTATALLSDSYSTGETVRLKISCAGASYAFGPGLTVYRAVDTSSTPVPRCSIISTAGVGDARYGFQGDELSIRGVWKAVYVNTPAAGNVFVLSIR